MDVAQDSRVKIIRLELGPFGTNCYIVITHSHFDHIGMLDELRDRLIIPVAIHPTGFENLSFRSDIDLCDGDCLKVEQLAVKVLRIPGHTQDSIYLLINKYLISGDTIFPGCPGKINTLAEFEQILNSLQSKI